MIFAKQRCWICHQEEPQNYSWASLSLKQNTLFLCDTCINQLEPLTGPRCLICSRMLKELSDEYIIDQLCYDCIRWQQAELWKHTLVQNISCYQYNPFLKEIMAKFKYRGDYALAEIFANDLKRVVSRSKFDFIVPIPLSEERFVERGFNQSEALIRTAKLEITQLLSRTHTEKQSKKSRRDRLGIQNAFTLNEHIENFNNKRILLVDDIYTTGSTVRSAAKVLLEAGACLVSSVTICR